MVLKLDDETQNYKLEFDFGDDKAGEESGELIDFSQQQSLGACPKCGGSVFEHGKNYVCERTVPTLAQPTPTCDFKSGQIILQQPIAREQMEKLLSTGKTDLLDKFVSMRTRRAFKAMLAWDAAADKVNFEFAPSKFPPRKTATAKPVAAKTTAKAPAKKQPQKQQPRKHLPKRSPSKPQKPRAKPRQQAPNNPVPHWPQ